VIPKQIWLLILTHKTRSLPFTEQYAFPTIIIDFIFQITFFVALIVIDERRIQANRRDCCFCCTAANKSEASTLDLSGEPEKHFADRLMARYADFLLRPVVKWVVIVVFAAMLGIFSWRTSELKQVRLIVEVLVEFKVTNH
jgi:Niemann-Pick C1 protein